MEDRLLSNEVSLRVLNSSLDCLFIDVRGCVQIIRTHPQDFRLLQLIDPPHESQRDFNSQVGYYTSVTLDSKPDEAGHVYGPRRVAAQMVDAG